MKNEIKLSAMMFVQYIMLPVWFVPMLPYVESLPDGSTWAVWCGLVMGFGTFASPLLGMFADRFFNAERVLAACNFAVAAVLVFAFFAGSGGVLFALMLAAMCFYMPSWSLTAAIAMANAPKSRYPRIRVFGTLGWVASGAFSLCAAKFFGIDNFDSTRWIFACGSAASAAGGVLALFMPKTAPCQRGQPLSAVDALGLRALCLFKDRRFLAFSAVILLAMVPFQWYNVYCAAYLKESGFKYLTFTLNLGQVGEMFFMLAVGAIIAKFGYRGAMAIGLSALAFRNASFAVSSHFGIAAFDFGAILVHGLIFGLFIVGAQMYVAENVPERLRSQAQGLMNLMTAGIGVFASNIVFNFILGGASGGARSWTRAYLVAFALSVVGIAAALLLLKGRGDAAEKGDGR